MDIAIWSAIEQGLAITAGCLATLRPLLKEFGYWMGWTKPSAASGGHTNVMGPQSGSHANMNTCSGNREMYDLSEFEQIKDEESKIESKASRRDMRARIIAFRTLSLKGKSGKGEKHEGMEIKTVCERNESQTELKDQQSKVIVVSKNFLVVSEWK